MTKRSLLLCACVALAAATIIAAAPQDSHSKSDPSTEAARLNNLGAAYMNQQLFEKGLKAFQEASALDPKLQIASLNQGIALLNLARIEPAKGLLEAAGKNAPNDPHAWFSLGLLYKNSDNPQGSVDAFRRVTEIDPNDADSWYFLGAASAQLKQYPQAIDAFQHALKMNPLHASAEFGIARAYQQSGDAAQAREHLVRFQHITQSKLGSPIGLAYGDQGRVFAGGRGGGSRGESVAADSGALCSGDRERGAGCRSRHPDQPLTWHLSSGRAHVSSTMTATASLTFFCPTTVRRAAWRFITTWAMASLKT